MSSKMIAALAAVGLGIFLVCGCDRKEESSSRVDPQSGYSKALEDASVTNQPQVSSMTELPKQEIVDFDVPSIEEVKFSPADFHQGIDLTIRPIISNRQEEVQFKYLWKINGEPFPWLDSPTLDGHRFKRGDLLSVEIIPTLNGKEGVPFISKEIEVPNAPPSITSAPPPLNGFEYQYDVKAVDPEGGAIFFSLTEGPKGMSINEETGRLRWNVHPDNIGDNPIHIEVRDDSGAISSQEFSLKVEIK